MVSLRDDVLFDLDALSLYLHHDKNGMKTIKTVLEDFEAQFEHSDTCYVIRRDEKWPRNCYCKLKDQKDFLQTTLTSHTESIIKELKGLERCDHWFPAFQGTCEVCGINRTDAEDDNGFNLGIFAAIQAIKSSL